MIYEALFLHLINNAFASYYVVDQTESQWFLSNPYNTSDWSSFTAVNKDVPNDLVLRLYEVNQESFSLNWIPVITNGAFLSEDYLEVSTRQPDKYCLVESETPTGVRDSISGYYFRPYYSVSRVAFSEGSRFAMLKYSKHCAPLSGAGEFFVVFQFSDNQWKIKAKKTLWIS